MTEDATARALVVGLTKLTEGKPTETVLDVLLTFLAQLVVLNTGGPAGTKADRAQAILAERIAWFTEELAVEP
jgi:hypothetical protein